jgi:hypothetical protein
MTLATEWTREEACRIRKKAYRFLLRDGRIWKHPKKRNGVPLQVVMKEEEQEELLTAFHEALLDFTVTASPHSPVLGLEWLHLLRGTPECSRQISISHPPCNSFP